MVSIEPQAVAVLEQPEMAAPYGGELKVREGEEGQLELMRSLYRVTLEPVDFSQALALSMPGRRGMVNVETEPRSLLSRTWREVVGGWASLVWFWRADFWRQGLWRGLGKSVFGKRALCGFEEMPRSAYGALRLEPASP
ncbi:hypothetical protein R2R70_04460 [Cobetia sp. SIMBA_158]|uniref:hypothetical protein n=1 Tax=Cobetia sp. SIMBA_158 TaxID=3081617 RepID=UPI00397EA6FF